MLISFQLNESTLYNIPRRLCTCFSQELNNGHDMNPEIYLFIFEFCNNQTAFIQYKCESLIFFSDLMIGIIGNRNYMFF